MTLASTGASDPAPPPRGRRAALAGLAVSLALLAPGVLLPVLTVRGTIEPGAVAALTPRLLERGLSDETVAALRPLLNPFVVPLLEASPGGLRQGLIDRLEQQIAGGLAGAGGGLEVYAQTRSILGAVRHLYAVGSPTAATLILLFSVVVPLGKTGLVLWALWTRDAVRRLRALVFVEVIAKWSMADVFAVALIIAYLAAQARPAAPPEGAGAAVVSFAATFGPGFYWFAAYCLFSLAIQQATARWVLAHYRSSGSSS